MDYYSPSQKFQTSLSFPSTPRSQLSLSHLTQMKHSLVCTSHSFSSSSQHLFSILFVLDQQCMNILSSNTQFITVSTLGNKNKNGTSKAGDNQPAPVVDKDELREIRKKTEKGQKSDAIVISHSELERMKAATKIQTKEQESQHRKLLEEQKDQQMADAKARK